MLTARQLSSDFCQLSTNEIQVIMLVNCQQTAVNCQHTKYTCSLLDNGQQTKYTYSLHAGNKLQSSVIKRKTRTPSLPTVNKMLSTVNKLLSTVNELLSTVIKQNVRTHCLPTVNKLLSSVNKRNTRTRCLQQSTNFYQVSTNEIQMLTACQLSTNCC